MTDNQFDVILGLLYEIHTEFPDMRFGEIIQGAIDTSKFSNNVNLHDITSKELFLSLKDFKERHLQKRNNVLKQKIPRA